MKECGCARDLADMEQMFYEMSSAEKMETIRFMRILLSEEDDAAVV